MQYDINPILLSSMATNIICVVSLSVTGIEHRKIDPKAKHFSHCKKDQSSRPNQTDNLKRLAKISNCKQKNSEKNQIILIDNQVHKPTIHRISANTPQKELHRIDLQEDRGELCIENQREREEAIQLITMDPKVCRKLLTTHRRGYGVDVEALHDGFPSSKIGRAHV